MLIAHWNQICRSLSNIDLVIHQIHHIFYTFTRRHQAQATRHLTSPSSRAGVLMGREEIERASRLCAAAGAWLILDNTYENFVYAGLEHFCLSAPHVLNVFSFSKVRIM